MEKVSSSNFFKAFHLGNALKKLDELTPSLSKDQLEFVATNQNEDQTNVFSEINQNAPHKEPSNETEKRFEEGNPIWKAKIYARRNNDQVVEYHIPQLSQESKPSESQPTQTVSKFLRMYRSEFCCLYLTQNYGIDYSVILTLDKLEVKEAKEGDKFEYDAKIDKGGLVHGLPDFLKAMETLRSVYCFLVLWGHQYRKRFEEGNPIWKSKIYTRRNNDQVVEDHIPQLSQESKPSESQPTQRDQLEVKAAKQGDKFEHDAKIDKGCLLHGLPGFLKAMETLRSVYCFLSSMGTSISVYRELGSRKYLPV
ncbi:hypothetical protein MTR_6g037500 [Medicago truncatula]|uniref:Uncharacterized protein n=1 Tax=Medicago truncatula TaxID=3880 RepID=A0A072UJC8_MEDTR|nr:hypothetical protein MTR_6g037500 [Medicago truncatula]